MGARSLSINKIKQNFVGCDKIIKFALLLHIIWIKQLEFYKENKNYEKENFADFNFYKYF